jgi:hypothetical protein
MAKAPFKVEWDAHEYEHKQRSPDWFWAMGIIAVSAAVAAIIFGNIIFAILIIVAVFSLSLYINRPPETIHVIIDEKGITRGAVRYPYDTIHSFWVDEDHPHRKIILRSHKLLMPLIIVPIADSDAEKLRRILSHYITEEFHTLPLTEKVLEFLGF